MTTTTKNVQEGHVAVSIGVEGFKSDVAINRHSFASDEPIVVGGGDAGPNPYDLLLAALGSCKTMTMRMYADRKGWPLEAARVQLSHKRIHAADCAECDTKDGKVDRISVEVELEGDLDDDQRRRLLEIADRCPVHRTLTSEISIESSLV